MLLVLNCSPICRTVSDAVYVLDAIVGFDPRDHEATKAATKFIPVAGYKQFLNKDGLKGKKLGVLRNPFVNLSNRSNAVPILESHLRTLRYKSDILLVIGQCFYLVNMFISST